MCVSQTFFRRVLPKHVILSSVVLKKGSIDQKRHAQNRDNYPYLPYPWTFPYPMQRKVLNFSRESLRKPRERDTNIILSVVERE